MNVCQRTKEDKVFCKEIYCKAELHLRKRLMKSCALDIVTNGTRVNCIVRKFESTQNYYIERLQSFWVVVFLETTSFVISCGYYERITK